MLLACSPSLSYNELALLLQGAVQLDRGAAGASMRPTIFILFNGFEGMAGHFEAIPCYGTLISSMIEIPEFLQRNIFEAPMPHVSDHTGSEAQGHAESQKAGVRRQGRW